MEEFAGFLKAVVSLSKIGPQNKQNKDIYPVFNTEETDPEKFWNKLNKGGYWMYGNKRYYHIKTEVGSLAVDQGFMTPNTGWDCSNTKFKDLTKKQQRIITATLKLKNESYRAIGIRSLCGNLFKIK